MINLKVLGSSRKDSFNIALLRSAARRPANFIVGVIDERLQVESAVNELHSLGFPEGSILVLHGKNGADAIRGRDQEPGFTGFLRHSWIQLSEFLSDQLDHVQRHIEAAEQGNYVIGTTTRYRYGIP